MKELDKDMLNKIKASAQDIKVPPQLAPEQVEKQLESRKRRKNRLVRMAAAAACLCLCFGAGSAAYYNNRNHTSESMQQAGQEGLAAKQDRKAAGTAGNDRKNSGVKSGGADSSTLEVPPLEKIGKMYTLASDYEEVFDYLKKLDFNDQKMRAELMKTEGGIDNVREEDITNSIAASDVSFGAMKTPSDSAGDYSTTNLQVEGVDESDIVKTDGRYIYVVQDAQVQILDVQNKEPKAAGKIVPKMDEDADAVREMYVSDHVLTLIIQTEHTVIEPGADGEDSHEISIPEGESDVVDSLDNRISKKRAYTDDAAYDLHTMAVTEVVTYDITDPGNPVLKDTTTQDGWYQTSRKIGSRLYLFTDKSLYLPAGLTRGGAICDDGLSGWLPCVDQKAVSADCIYLPKNGSQGLLMASIDLADHNKVLDTKLLVNNFANLYVSRDSAYLYYTDYVNSVEKTRIARFALNADGTIQAKAASTLKGSIQDTFAIYENDGYLYALTSVTSAEPWENRVYVLDEGMEVAGKLTGLAEGEMIYAARFVGKTGYFVTYRNTDPLFTVDFSDPQNPKIIGELKVTGFSEYLHFWDDNKLLGIGYETKPDSGERVGVKLSMFDISNPGEVKEEAKLVLEDVDDCVGMENYKAVLVSRQKNIIGLATESYGEQYHADYRVFAYEDGKFVSRLERQLDGDNGYAYGYYGVNGWRGLYVGDVLYLVNAKKTVAFDMQDGFQVIGKVKYKEH